FPLHAVLGPMQPRDDLAALSAAEKQRYDEQLSAWEAATRGIREEMDKLTAGKRTELRTHALEKFRPEIQQAALTQVEQRTPYQMQIAYLAELQLKRE